MRRRLLRGFRRRRLERPIGRRPAKTNRFLELSRLASRSFAASDCSDPDRDPDPSSSRESFDVDFSEPLVAQVGHLGARYMDWVHAPETSSEPLRFFANPALGGAESNAVVGGAGHLDAGGGARDAPRDARDGVSARVRRWTRGCGVRVRGGPRRSGFDRRRARRRRRRLLERRRRGEARRRRRRLRDRMGPLGVSGVRVPPVRVSPHAARSTRHRRAFRRARVSSQGADGQMAIGVSPRRPRPSYTPRGWRSTPSRRRSGSRSSRSRGVFSGTSRTIARTTRCTTRSSVGVGSPRKNRRTWHIITWTASDPSASRRRFSIASRERTRKREMAESGEGEGVEKPKVS